VAHGSLDGLWCVSATSCTATGFRSSSRGQLPLAEISCVSARTCTAVGDNTLPGIKTSRKDLPLAEHE
jgi:hypothetical protein